MEGAKGPFFHVPSSETPRRGEEIAGEEGLIQIGDLNPSHATLCVIMSVPLLRPFIPAIFRLTFADILPL